MTSLEYQLCKKYPELIFYLFTSNSELSAKFKDCCRQQFGHERWDCKNVDRIPLFKATSVFLTLGEYCIYMASVCMIIFPMLPAWESI